MIDPHTTIGEVHLTISDLDRSVRFYQTHLGFTLHHGGDRRGDQIARLGAGGPDLLVLSPCETAPRVRGTTGLYHFAILVPSRFDVPFEATPEGPLVRDPTGNAMLLQSVT